MVKKKKVSRSRGEEGVKVIPELDTSIDLDNQEEETQEEIAVSETESEVNSVVQLVKILEGTSTPNSIATYVRKDTKEIVCLVTNTALTSTLAVMPSEWAVAIANGVYDSLYGEGIDPQTADDIENDGWDFIFEATLV